MLDFPASRTVRNQYSSSKPPSLWCSVKATWADWDIETQVFLILLLLLQLFSLTPRHFSPPLFLHGKTLPNGLNSLLNHLWIFKTPKPKLSLFSSFLYNCSATNQRAECLRLRLLIHCALHPWVRIPFSSASASLALLTFGFPGSSVDEESTCKVGDLGLIPGLGRSPGGRHGNPLQHSCPENPQEPGEL